ncbi:hypothetical protein [Streptomyces sp. NPDC005805]|uniref:hypothetical protein n=1 Tax=Streptomyces sp. NPDC005805 TaxID=3157068 RepID=UPI003405BCEA
MRRTTAGTNANADANTRAARTARARGLTAAAAVAVLLAAGAGTAVALGERSGGGSGPAPAAAPAPEIATPAPEAAAPARAATAASGPRVVRPYEPVAIGGGAVMGLLPEGRQNYVVAWQDFEESIERAKGYTGDDIRPGSLSGGQYSDGDDVLFTGAWRLDTAPARVTVRVGAGGEREAGILTLPGEPGWGTYHLDAPGSGTPREITVVTAYAGDGTVLADLAYEPFPSSGPAAAGN